jgi:hypothetical protein
VILIANAEVDTASINARVKIFFIVLSYFGLREVKASNGKIYLNGKELYQKLVLDQGYFLESHLSAPSNQALYEDITKMIELGFNGCRKHQKIEDERFIYYADVLGYLMWCEMPSMYANTSLSRATFEVEWLQIVKQHYNHPCIITWTPLNESWGVEHIKTRSVEQDFANLIYHLTKEYDPYRFVITNDGWEHTISDILTIHHYEQDGEKLIEDLMIAANEIVSETIESMGLSFIYRIHEKPKSKKMENFMKMSEHLGYRCNFSSLKVSPKELQKLMDKLQILNH